MFFSRENELASLSLLWKKNVASFVTCRGRRRIGKSSLIEEFARRSKCHFFELVGAAPQPKMTNADQLTNFMQQLAIQSGLPLKTDVSNWIEAFSCLDSVLSPSEKTIVLLDEASWMGRYDPNFAGCLKTVWDTKLKLHNRLILIVCGSVSTWIAENILENSAFAGRLSLNLVVEELPLRDCVKFWGDKCKRLSVQDVLDVLSVVGGVPKYLEEIDTSVSADENIRRLCFLPNGPLVGEFDQIFSEVFSESAPVKKDILRTLGNGPLTATQIAERLGNERNGHLTRQLKELETAGFVAREGGLNPQTDAPLKIERYRIKDNYTRFYLHHMEPRMTSIHAGSYTFKSLADLPEWQTLMGLQFENLVVSHFRELLPHLRIGPQLILSAAPYAKKGKTPGEGLQIDLLLQMRRAVYLIEVKRQDQITSDVEHEMQEKVSRLPVKGIKSRRTALVYAGKIDPQIAENGYFDALIPIEELLEINSVR